MAGKPSVAAFGGLYGGRKRADGLVPGSPEAKKADLAKDAARKREARARLAEQTSPALPSSLPGSGVVADSPAVPVADNATPVPAAASGFVVPWSVRVLQKPARLITRVIDRLRQIHLFKKLDKAQLPEPVARELKKDLAWSEAAVNDFADALAECAAIELNKAQISSVNQHWINLGITGAELMASHFSLASRIDQLVLATKLANGQNAGQQHQKPPEKTA